MTEPVLDQWGADSARRRSSRSSGSSKGWIGRRWERLVNERVIPAVLDKSEATAARYRAVLANMAVIADRHPDLHVCLTDDVIFLAGGSRVLPVPRFEEGITIEEADALVARLRDG